MVIDRVDQEKVPWADIYKMASYERSLIIEIQGKLNANLLKNEGIRMKNFQINVPKASL